ncbi:DUF4097 family beta strand repeat-containing protein [Liquorilactobacillus satsumensis]|uniref:DUF4097 family beta strand repeat-containing protein n=1 Tax=Liquorilactobacillus satsumensis TaxID=259059 RepID=UPI001E2899D1|nr:DUF4097 family beta strand repeat-containing protein [Liquorilactobacillus satsumensis]MCC7666745.1 hypothetical protein [Liquorilactobacillus satsumensis]MCP9312636.1 DUF4097 family beta strand repeat protein [Liquorilactobacillus satsumensis]MCP9327585.1 DUF4097 family beta strand repeat protein [Liquorilactobacillus satsumensis]MCP9357621.1 DUF4097 family beta strand repeat protein [Liquorilactobacillus satsumensis]MCP9359822.1 DUF4097 family beta strand repeat protein [Liquorilactobacil
MKKTLLSGMVILGLGLLLMAAGYLFHGAQIIAFQGWQPVSARTKFSGKVVKRNVEFKQIYVETRTADVEVRSGSEASVMYTADSKNTPTVKVTNGVLNVRQTKASDFSGFYFGVARNEKVVITVPNGRQLRNVTVNSKTGDLRISGQSVDQLNAFTDTGDAYLANVKAKRAAIYLNNGDAVLKNVSFGSGRLQQTNGDLTLKDSQLTNVIIHNTDGDVTFTDSQFIKGNLSLSSGDLEANHNKFSGVYTIENKNGDNEVADTQVKGIRVETNAGTNQLFSKTSEGGTLQQGQNNSNMLILRTDSGDNEVK